MNTPGTGVLLRANLRRDRVLVAVWIWMLAAMVAASAFAIVDLYPSAAERMAATRLINTSPALVALYGPIVHEGSLGELAMSKMTVMYAAFVMGMALVLVRRHTRGEEESGRAEVLGATLIDRDAPLRAALAEGALASAALGVLAAVLNVVAGLDLIGSIAFGLSWVGIGVVGTGLAAVCCQLSASSRACGGIALSAIGVLSLLRAVGDLGPDVLGWLSPLGWGTRLHAWQNPRWWVLGLYAVTAAVLMFVAQALRARRDLGSGLLTDRRGPGTGALGSLAALTWRMNRTATLWWLLGTLAWGFLLGSVTPNLGGFFDSPSGKAALEALGGQGQVQDVMLAALLAIMAVLVTGFALQIVAYAGHEETNGRTAVLLAAPASRTRAFLAPVSLALGGSGLLTIAYAIGSALGFGPQTEGVGHALRVLVPASLAHVPAIWVVTALAVLAWAIRPTLAAWTGWALLLGFVSVGELGPLLRLPEWVIELSPYQHTAKVPVQPIDWTSEIALLLVTAGLLAAAWWRYRARDIG